MANSQPHAPKSPEDRRLLSIAAQSIRHGLRHGTPSSPDESHGNDPLTAPGASFVTLFGNGQLRGCIGSILPMRPLAADVAENAFAAAFRDSRFPPLTPQELDDLSIEVSVLSPLEKIPAASDADLVRVLKPGEDGLVLHDNFRRAVFLPQVWEQIAAPADFIAALKRKGGFDVWEWPADMQAERFHVREIGPQPIGAIA